MLFSESYVNGSFKRKCQKETFLYYRYNKRGLFIDKAKNNLIIKDSLCNQFPINKKAYFNEIEKLFIDFHKLEECTNEEICGIVEGIRAKYFGEEYSKIRERQNKEKITKVFKYKSENLEKEVPKIISRDISKLKLSSINRDKLISDVIKSEKSLVLLCDDLVDLITTLKIISDNEIKKPTIHVLVKNIATINEPTTKEIKKYIADKETLQTLKVEFSEYKNQGLGLDIRNISTQLKEIFYAVQDGEKDLLVTGEGNLFSLTDTTIPYYLLARVEDFTSQAYTNIFLESDGVASYISTYVAGGYKTAINFHGVKRGELNLEHYDYLYFKLPQEIKDKYKDNLLLGALAENLNILPNKFGVDNCDKDPVDLDDNSVVIYKDKFTSKLAKGELEKREMKYLDFYYEYDKHSVGNYEVSPLRPRNGVLVRGVLVENNKDLELSVRLAEDYNSGIISVRELLKRGKTPSGFQLYSNCLYFFTENLKRLYNDRRLERVKEQIDLEPFYLDYRYYSNNGNEQEFFPLYNKGYLGFDKKGQIFFGQKKLGSGELTIGNVKIKWQEDDINNLAKPFTIITPLLLDESPTEVNSEQYLIGRERLNITIINNIITCIRFGDIALPSVGVVLSFSKEKASNIIDLLGLVQKEAGYFDIPNIAIKLSLVKNALEKNAKWIFGGGTLLVKDGVSLMDNEVEAEKNFRLEGWYNPLSMQTQETQVQNWVRGPRSVIGVTREGKLFILSFSGRDNETAGARFDEIIQIIKKYIGEVRDMINLDGGASVCFGMISDNNFFELNIPAPSDFNIRGMVRPVNSMLFLGRGASYEV